MKKNTYSLLVIVLVLITSCSTDNSDMLAMKPSEDAVSYLEKSGDEYQLFFQGEPFYIKGVTSFGEFDNLSEYGGNCVRLWDTDTAMASLDKAHEHNLAVMLVLNMLSERQGMDYSNREWVLAQRARLSKDVMKYKDHPALLMWSLGNELDLDYKNLEVWRELDTLSKMVQRLDDKHLITTSIMPKRSTLDYLEEHCPGIPIVGINSFGFAPDVENLMGGPRGWHKPYFLSEWGPKGYWEVYQTDWEASYEANSTEKSAFMSTVYQNHIEPNKTNCVGSFVFFWGHKQERTHTWFSFFDENGNPSELAHTLRHFWTGEGNGAPRFDIGNFALNGIAEDKSIYLQPGEKAEITIDVAHRDGMENSSMWEIRAEGSYRGINGGDQEPDTSPLEGLITNQSNTSLQFNAPSQEGAYRVFYTVKDSTGTFGTANKCFFVMSSGQ